MNLKGVKMEIKTGCSLRDSLISAVGLGIAADGCRVAEGLFDFTCGAWCTNKPSGIADIYLQNMDWSGRY